MEITLLYFEDCSNWKLADERLTSIAAERNEITVTHHLVATPAEAERTRFHAHRASWSTASTRSPSPTRRWDSHAAGT